MNCIIPSGNMKIVGRALQTLAKVGDELYVEAKPHYLQFATINQNKTSYVTFNFESIFFSVYEIDNMISGENGNALTCKLYMKAILSIFKTKGPKDKKIDSCKIELDNDPTRIIFKLKYKQDVIVIHSIRLIDMEFVSVSYDKDNMMNRVNGTGHLFTQILTNFQTSDNDMSLDIKRNKIVIRNYDVASNQITKCIRSHVVLNADEFTSYTIREESNITLSFKPFRAAVAFAEMFNLQVIINFDTGGRPVILTTSSSTFEVNFVLSTISPDGCTQSCTTSTSLPNGKSNDGELSKEDRTALEVLNWDSDFEVDDDDILLNDNLEINTRKNTIENENIIPRSPESPRSKRLKIVFGRCLEPTYNASQLDFGEELAANSDSE